MHRPQLLFYKLCSLACRPLAVGLIFVLTGCAGNGGTVSSPNSGASPLGPTRAWTEEVLLHDGSIISARTTYLLGGRSEPGAHESTSTSKTVVFITPAGEVEWTTDFRDSQPEPNSLSLIAFDIVDGVPYVATRPAGCIAFNEWQRPNPPQVLFKYVNRQWVRIGLEEFPRAITRANMVLGRPSTEVLKPFYSVMDVQKENYDVKQLEYRSILREAMGREQIASMCDELINYKGHWIDPRNPFARKYIDEKQSK